MPFQISLICSSKQAGVINSFDAGDSQFATCALSVTLSATVNGDVRGHALLWEQISGDAQIVFVTPTNQLTVTYNVIGLGSADRTFRFYIDKGTSQEQYDDVIVWGTPTEVDTQRLNIFPSPTSIDSSCRNISCGSIQMYYSFPAPTESGSYANNPITGFVLHWTAPSCDSQYFTGTDVKHNVGGILTTLGTVLPSAPQEIAIPSTLDAYYLYTNYKEESNYYTQYSCRFYQDSIPGTATTIITDTVDFNSIISSNGATYYSLIHLPTFPVIDIAYEGVSVISSSPTTIYYTLAFLTDNVSTGGVTSSVINNAISATYFSNNGIGG